MTNCNALYSTQQATCIATNQATLINATNPLHLTTPAYSQADINGGGMIVLQGFSIVLITSLTLVWFATKSK